jgi:hypothetical protein
MGLYMRTVMRDWHDPPFDEVASYVEEHSQFRLQPIGDRGWAEFEALNQNATTVLAADLAVGDEAREELDELEEFLDDLDGSQSAREAVRAHLHDATAVVGMQVLPSVYDDSVAAANIIIAYLEQRPGVLTQIDTVGWYDGPNQILHEPA